jgi:hypothetical protein
VVCWGRNGDGQLGNGHTSDTTIENLLPVIGISNATSIGAGKGYTCATLNGGAAQCWGINTYGQLGNGKTSMSPIPVVATGVDSAAMVSVGSLHNCTLLRSGEVQCWGLNESGQGGPRQKQFYTPGSVLSSSGLDELNLNSITAPIVATDADKVFAWAEKSYPTVFAPTSQFSQTTPGYRYRVYGGGHCLAVNDSGTASLYYLGPLSNNAVLDLGPLSEWLLQAAP